MLARVFRAFPGMEYCDLKKDRATGRSKGYAYVSYLAHEAAAAAQVRTQLPLVLVWFVQCDMPTCHLAHEAAAASQARLFMLSGLTCLWVEVAWLDAAVAVYDGALAAVGAPGQPGSAGLGRWSIKRQCGR